MDNREKILQFLKLRKVAKTSALVKELKISRQKVVKHLDRLIKDGLILKEGATRSSKYIFVEGKRRPLRPNKVKFVKNLKGLEEDKVYEEVELKLGLKKIPPTVQSIIFYAFGEMLNNAIDHSKSKKVDIEVVVDSTNFEFKIKDAGIGIFANVKNKFHLNNEFDALEHILKGKQTTFPERHSGQGIFFTSKIADIFRIRSHKIEMTNNNIADDLQIKEIKGVRGTEIFFQIKKRTQKILKDLFNKYANEEYEFDRTNVKVKLTADRELLARSQAKRLMEGLDQYKIITLDFKKVKEIGQAFVDEVFRVYKKRYPHIQINYINANPAVEFMIQRGHRSKANLKT